MSERERHVNHSLRALDEAHRLGRLTREEYRSRRRHLLGALRDSHVVTARNAIVRSAPPPQAAVPMVGDDVLRDVFSSRLPMWKWMLPLLVAGVLLCAGLWYWLSKAG
ncbi:hypothetical protein [Dyella flagellata]|uniref:DUF1707 domain-containing protein n=1 Tax=Dyella flagellata TaxID=1867833 RepID=A0ABQ5X8L0_9GAMM|nr:hypothetical protein [Dyella flagellata]GLQ87398.1 hypothetical protein GCM10007898_09640 [Dyella flagellata]